jgi:hypothetical protein
LLTIDTIAHMTRIAARMPAAMITQKTFFIFLSL